MLYLIAYIVISIAICVCVKIVINAYFHYREQTYKEELDYLKNLHGK